MENNKKYIDQNGLTVIAEIAPGSMNDLISYLDQIGSDDIGGGIIGFSEMTGVHFARWFIIDSANESDGKGGYSPDHKFPDSIAYTSNFDGSVDGHLEQVMTVSGSAIRKLYSYCKDFPDHSATDREVINWLKKRSHKNQLFWPAIRGGTVEQLKGEGKLRDDIQQFLTSSLKDGKISGKGPEEIRQMITDFVKNNNDLAWALTPRAKTSLGWKFRYYGRLAIKLFWLLPMAALFGVWFALVGTFNKRDDKYRKAIERSRDFEALLKNEDRIFMNQLTVYGGIKKPYWYRTMQLRIGLWIFSLNGVYRSNKGQLSGIETIHFARWSIFNNGRNVMFLSNFDGAWEIYLSEFIDRSAAAMNLTFGTTVGYPKVTGFFGEGAHDEQAFKTVVRNNQYPCQVWYSAYPRLTIKNMLNNKKIREFLAGTSDESTEDWLKRF